MAALAYADHAVTVVIKDQCEMDALAEHLVRYEQASGAKLNPDETEGVWIGSEQNRTDINIQVIAKRN